MQKKKTTNKATTSGPTKRKKQALGKGLGALIPEIEKSQEDSKDFFYCEIEMIRPNRLVFCSRGGRQESR